MHIEKMRRREEVFVNTEATTRIEKMDRVMETLRSAVAVAHVGGSTRRPEIYLGKTLQIEKALEEVGINAFPEGGFLVVSAWHDIEILSELGLPNINEALQHQLRADSTIMEKPSIIHLLSRSNENMGATGDYVFPINGLVKKFPLHTPMEKKGGLESKTRKSNSTDEHLEAHFPNMCEELQAIVDDWLQGVSEEELPREYTKIPNLTLFKQKYKWVKRKLYRRAGKVSWELVPETEHHKILTLAKKGNPAMLAEVTKIHIGLVLRVVAKLQEVYGGEADDMLQHGFEGLLEAVKKCEPSRGAFSTYATYWIDKEIRRQYGNTHRLIRRPLYRNSAIADYYETIRTLPQQLGREPRRADLCTAFNMTDVALDAFEREMGIGRELVGLAHEDQLTPGHVSYEGPELNHNGASDTCEQAWMDEKLPQFVGKALQNMKRPRCADVIVYRYNVCSPRMAVRMTSPYGDNDTNLTLEQVADILGVTRERVRQIEAKGLRLLRHPSIAEGLRDFL